MTTRNLIVARLDAGHRDRVAELFARSDESELPEMLGVRRRTLFTFHDLYFHLVETDEDLQPQLSEVRKHPLFREIDEGLAPYVKPYHPSWREPKDALAAPFYQWRRA
ncbi:TcmI family type II polyketide cyclase [Streptomyces sp. MST-110588]|uniref:TcmI family type II polyketide cyclase n=1 Tax=Streptomyces sp. MST-110588 TaxID=2833628 RepID=UPI001F5DE6A7|nr:TcmI family type II polyketide cyclase [Streptomyces sp. MST-110588]UNO40782.1 TcmI family type II polyketide cyclase [Streptomyces sp. MST-110588]